MTVQVTTTSSGSCCCGVYIPCGDRILPATLHLRAYAADGSPAWTPGCVRPGVPPTPLVDGCDDYFSTSRSAIYGEFIDGWQWHFSDGTPWTSESPLAADSTGIFIQLAFDLTTASLDSPDCYDHQAFCQTSTGTGTYYDLLCCAYAKGGTWCKGVYWPTGAGGDDGPAATWTFSELALDFEMSTIDPLCLYFHVVNLSSCINADECVDHIIISEDPDSLCTSDEFPWYCWRSNTETFIYAVSQTYPGPGSVSGGFSRTPHSGPYATYADAKASCSAAASPCGTCTWEWSVDLSDWTVVPLEDSCVDPCVCVKPGFSGTIDGQRVTTNCA